MEAQHKGCFTACNGVCAAPPTLLLAAGHPYYGIPGSVECAGVADWRNELADARAELIDDVTNGCHDAHAR